MPADLIQPATSLGVAGFAILIMWWMYQSAAAERGRYDDRMDTKDLAFRALEREVRTEITTQLIASTATNTATQRVMERVLDKLDGK
jgi:hypothetical protein